MSVHSTKTSQKLYERFTALSTPVQLGVAVIFVAIALLFLSDYVWPVAESMNDRTEEIERTLATSQQSQQKITNNVRLAVETLGPIEIPEAKTSGYNLLSIAIAKIMMENNIDDYKLSLREGGKMPNTTLQAVIGMNMKIERIVGELKFTSSPQTMIDILVGFESNPTIEGINRVRIDKDLASKRLTVGVDVESWVLVPNRMRDRVTQ